MASVGRDSSSGLAQLLDASARPSLINDLDEGVILFANHAASTLLADDSQQIEGRLLKDFLSRDLRQVLNFMAHDEISAYEADCRVLRTGERVTVSSRIAHDVAQTVCVTAIQTRRGGGSAPGPVPAGHVVGVGSAGPDLVIAEVTLFSGGMAARLPQMSPGTSILDCVLPAWFPHVAAWREAVEARQTASGHPLVLPLNVLSKPEYVLTLAPRSSSDGHLFTVLQLADNLDGDDASTDHNGATGGVSVRRRRALMRTSQGRETVAGLLSRLAPREVEVITELLNGYRGPSIAQRLFLSPGTVRNHLSAAYRKLGVKGQQELIELFRNARTEESQFG